MANSFLQVMTLVRTELTKLAIPMIPMMILNAPPMVMMRVITQRQEDFIWEVKPGFACVAGGGRVPVGPNLCHDDKIIAVVNDRGKAAHCQAVHPHRISNTDIGVVYDGSIVISILVFVIAENYERFDFFYTCKSNRLTACFS